MAVDPENDPKPGDLEYNLLWKILDRLTHVSGGGGGGGTPGGVNGNIQFNNAGAFGGASDFLYNSGTGLVSLLALNVSNKILLNAAGSASFASGGAVIDATGNITVGLNTIHTDGSASFANASTVLAADGAVSFLYGATAFNADGSVDFSGSLDMGSHRIHSVTDPAVAQDAATKNYADGLAAALASLISAKVSKAGDTMTGALDMNGSTVLNEDGSAQFAVGQIFFGSDGSANFANGQTNFYSDGTVLLSNTLDMGGHQILQVADPSLPQDAATKAYADTKQTALGYTPENVANKDIDGTLAANSDTKYASQKATKTYADTKQAALGFTPENIANKDVDGTLAANSDVKYPSQKAVKTYADTKQTALGFTPENVANKDIDGTLAANSDTKYASQKATKTYADTKQSALGFTPENVANKDVDGTLAANSDTKYPSQKAVKTYVDTGLATKQASLGFTAENVANKSTAVALGASDTLYPSQKAVKAYIDAVPNRLSAAANGSPYTLTTTAALVSFLTTSPVVTLDKPGTYWISAYASAEFAGATFAAGRVLTIKLRRTNNTAADLTGSGSTFTIPVVTTVTHTLAVITLPPLLYTTANSNDVIEMWASLSALPSAGSMSIRVPTVLQAVRLLTG